MGDGSIILHLRYDKGLPAPKPIVPNLKLEPSKQIDYLGDKVANGNTTRILRSISYAIVYHYTTLTRHAIVSTVPNK